MENQNTEVSNDLTFASQADFEDWDNTGRQAVTQSDAEGTEELEQSAETVAEEAAETETAEDDKDASDESAQEEKEEQASTKKVDRRSERIRTLVSERDIERQRAATLETRNRELEARLNGGQNSEQKNTQQQQTTQQAKATDELPPKPRLSDFDFDEDALAKAEVEWLDKRDTHIESQRQAKAAQARQQQEIAATQAAINEKLVKARAKYSDFDAVVNPLPISEAMLHTMLAEANTEDIAYHLGKNPGEAHRIANLPVYAQAAAIARLADKLVKPSIPVPAVTSKKPAFKPPTTVAATGGGSKKELTDPNLTQREFEELEARLYSKRR